MADIHLLVLIHGMWGNPGHLARMHEIILETKGKAKTTEGDLVSLSQATDTELIVLVAQTNRDEWTYDGIDWGGERIAKEVRKNLIFYRLVLHSTGFNPPWVWVLMMPRAGYG